MKTHYATAKEVNGYFRGVLYHYDDSGNREIRVWQSSELYSTREEAIDSVFSHLETVDPDSKIECEID